MFSRRASWISVFHHPFLLGSGCFLFILYKLFPSLVVFLVKSSPDIACTALLLGIILLYGEPNIPEAEERDQRDSNARIKNKERTKENNGVKRRKNKGMASKGRSAADRKDIAREHSDIEQVVAGTAASCSSAAAHHRRKNLMKNREHCADKPHHGLTKANRNTGHENSDKRRIPGLKLERCNFERCFESTVGSPWKHVNHTDDASSNSDSDNVESSSASEADAIAVLHELDSDDAVSDTVLQDLESDDDSIEEEAENQDDDEDDDDDDDDDDEAQEKEDDNKAAVTWTADDQRTLVHLGNSELERNHRVENLIAMRRAWRALRQEKEGNSIELDGNNTLLSPEEMSRFNIQLPSIYTSRSNPFDLPFNSEDIPGSAPSVLLPRRNPFDLPYEHIEQNVTVATGNVNRHEVMAPPMRDMLFRRHESFTIGAPFFGDPNHERRNYKFKPFFLAERMMGEERVPTNMARQLGKASDMESHTASLLSDQEHQRDLQGIESATDHNVEFTDRASISLEEAESVGMVNSSVLDLEKVERGHEDYESNSSVPSRADGNGSKTQISEQATSRGLAFTSCLAYSRRGSAAPSRLLSKKTGDVPENHIVDPVGDVPWVAPSLASIDRMESTSREISIIRERDVIGDELCKVHKGFGGGGIVPTLPELAARQSLLSSMSGLSPGRRSSAGS